MKLLSFSDEKAPILWLHRLGAFYFSTKLSDTSIYSTITIKKEGLMKVTINNKETETQALNVKQLAEELNLPATGVAVAISNTMVPRDEWESTKILEGADIVIIKAFCGG